MPNFKQDNPSFKNISDVGGGIGVWGRMTKAQNEARLVNEGPNAKGYGEQRFPTEMAVKVTDPTAGSWFDSVKGLNQGHAMARARANWPASEVRPISSNPVAQQAVDFWARSPEGQSMYLNDPAALDSLINLLNKK